MGPTAGGPSFVVPVEERPERVATSDIAGPALGLERGREAGAREAVASTAGERLATPELRLEEQ